jgi:hypothetical protein
MSTNQGYKAKVRPHGPIEDHQQPLQPERVGLDGFDPSEPGFERAAQDIVEDQDIDDDPGIAASDDPAAVRERLRAASFEVGPPRIKEQFDLEDCEDLEVSAGPDAVEELADVDDASEVENVENQDDFAPRPTAANQPKATGAGPEARRSIARKSL